MPILLRLRTVSATEDRNLIGAPELESELDGQQPFELERGHCLLVCCATINPLGKSARLGPLLVPSSPPAPSWLSLPLQHERCSAHSVAFNALRHTPFCKVVPEFS